MKRNGLLKIKSIKITCFGIVVLIILNIVPAKAIAFKKSWYNFIKQGSGDILTLAMVASKYNKVKGEEEYDEALDINKDGIIDIYDIVLVAKSMEVDLNLDNSDASNLSSVLQWWWYIQNDTNSAPDINPNIPFNLEKYGGMYVGDTSRKVIYLTFDTEYKTSNINKILQVLRENDAKANFFVISWFIDNNSYLLKDIINDGHLVANHSDTHKLMPSLAGDKIKFQDEIKNLERKFKAVTGKNIPKYFRAPEGQYTEQSLKYTKDLGYKTVFWSFSHMDWNDNAQPDKESAKNDMINNFHNGEIMLLHASSDTNIAVLDDVIKEGKRQGYSFEVLP